MSGMGDMNKELLDGKVLSDLKVIAKQLNIKGITKLKKNELITRIMEEISGDGTSAPTESTSADAPVIEGSSFSDMDLPGSAKIEEKIPDVVKDIKPVKPLFPKPAQTPKVERSMETISIPGKRRD